MVRGTGTDWYEAVNGVRFSWSDSHWAAAALKDVRSWSLAVGSWCVPVLGSAVGLLWPLLLYFSIWKTLIML